jgi:UPF0755 protein
VTPAAVRAAAYACVISLVGLCGIGAWVGWTLWRPLDNREVRFHVPEGTTGRAALELLHDEGLLPSVLAGRLYMRLLSDDRAVHYGHYAVPARSRPVDVLEQLLSGEVETFRLTVVEGSTADEIAELCAVAGLGTVEDWRRITAAGTLIEDLAFDAPSLEGFLFPDTYRFAVGLPAETAAGHMVERFREVWRDLVPPGAQLWGEPLEVVTMASLVEAETSVGSERRRIAGVFANRLDRGMLLQCDPTVVYALKRRGEWRGRLLRRHWQVDDPYNTYRFPALPPGPINSPGRAALEAAADPEHHDFLYFVAAPEGGHAFSKTLAEHERAAARLYAARR